MGAAPRFQPSWSISRGTSRSPQLCSSDQPLHHSASLPWAGLAEGSARDEERPSEAEVEGCAAALQQQLALGPPWLYGQSAP